MKPQQWKGPFFIHLDNVNHTYNIANGLSFLVQKKMVNFRWIAIRMFILVAISFQLFFRERRRIEIAVWIKTNVTLNNIFR